MSGRTPRESVRSGAGRGGLRWRAAGWAAADAARRALRTLRRAPGVSALVIACLALGTAAPAAVFLLVEGLLLQPLPGIERQRELLELELEGNASFPTYLDLAGTEALAETAAYSDTLLSVRRGERVERVLALTVTGSYFRVLGTRPAAGRLLSEPDDRASAPPVAVVSSGMAERLFGGPSRALGETLHVNGSPFEVVGVAPPGFVGTFVGFQFDLWVPFAWIGVTEPGSDPRRRDLDLVEVAARLSPGTSRAAAQTELDRAVALLKAEHSRELDELRAVLLPTTGIDPSLQGPAVAVLATLLGGSLVLTLLAAAPVANVLLARTLDRAGEMALRRALGASRAQVAVLVLFETLVLAMIGALLGVLAGTLAARLLWALEPPLPVALAIDLRPGWRAAVFGAALGLGLGAALGLLQSARLGGASASALAAGLRRGERRSRRRGLLVAGQVALSALLLLVAALFARSMTTTARMDPGFAVDRLVVLPVVDLDLSPEPLDPGVVVPHLLARLEALPGVERASAVSRLPLELFGGSEAPVTLDGSADAQPEDRRPLVDFATVEPGYFEVAEVAMLQGRGFGAGDHRDALPVAVVSRAMAGRFWPEEDPIGQRLTLGDGPSRTVVGVAADTMVRRFGEAPRPFVYLPMAQRPTARFTVLLRGRASPDGLGEPVRDIFRELAADLPPPQPLSARDYLAISLLPQRVIAWVAGVLGIVGVMLAAVGVYGVSSYAVSMRRRELAVRTSLGARPRDLRRLVLGEGMGVAGVGLAAGLLLAAAAATVLRALLVGVGPLDAPTYLGVGGGLLAVSLLATLPPARRAARSDPSEALRAE